MKQAHHVHKWHGIDTKTKGIFRKKHVVVLACTCGQRVEAEVGAAAR